MRKLITKSKALQLVGGFSQNLPKKVKNGSSIQTCDYLLHTGAKLSIIKIGAVTRYVVIGYHYANQDLLELNL